MPQSPPPPESLASTVTPAQVLERFERIREQYRMGVLDLQAFNAGLKLFQFPDAGGALWTVGATSNTWYRWDGGEWRPGTPPPQLQLPVMPLELMPESDAPRLPPARQTVPAAPRAVGCPKCGAQNVGKKFCTHCGTRL
jgi:hypothetical protein